VVGIAEPPDSYYLAVIEAIALEWPGEFIIQRAYNEWSELADYPAFGLVVDVPTGDDQFWRVTQPLPDPQLEWANDDAGLLLRGMRRRP
jgi:hypothetical protein